MGNEGDGQDVGTDLIEMITKVNENANIESALEELATKLADQLDAYEEQIIEILSDW
jgi:hypothetical protein